MMSGKSDYDKAELWVSADALDECFGMPINVDFAVTDARLDRADKNLATYPTAYREARAAHFIFFPTDPSRFFYSVRELYGAGITSSDDRAERAVLPQRRQTDRERHKGLGGEALHAPLGVHTQH